ncbi:hypothetical protein, partial [Mycobacterium sp.]|uniref:hypothetical protein n=1 Tax=Mycobacterium sp. TaxID=1785 RepID=UPI003BAE429E
ARSLVTAGPTALAHQALLRLGWAVRTAQPHRTRQSAPSPVGLPPAPAAVPPAKTPATEPRARNLQEGNTTERPASAGLSFVVDPVEPARTYVIEIPTA